MQGSLPAISKDVFCSALKLIKEQEAVDDEFSKRCRRWEMVISSSEQRTNTGELS